MTETQMDQDNQKFLKKLSDDQQQLEDRLDTLQLLVAGFSGRTDIGKAAETANEVRRVTKELKECQQQSSLYNQRERLFELYCCFCPLSLSPFQTFLDIRHNSYIYSHSCQQQRFSCRDSC